MTPADIADELMRILGGGLVRQSNKP